MTECRFEWDEAKNRSNQRKHGVSFEEAARIFVVVHTTTEEGGEDQTVEVIRIISARRADRRERRRYENETG